MGVTGFSGTFSCRIGPWFSHRLLDKHLEHLLPAGLALCTASAATFLGQVQGPQERPDARSSHTSACCKARAALQRSPERPCWQGGGGRGRARTRGPSPGPSALPALLWLECVVSPPHTADTR